MTRLATLISLAIAAPAFAHEGHGAPSTHWHATDTWGFVVTLVLVGAAVWFSRRK